MRDFDWYILSSLYKTGNITRSAEELFITQPTLTKRLQAIEQELGCQLVVRSNKGISFTPVGKRVLERAQMLIETMQTIKQDISSFASGDNGTLFLGVPYSYSRFVLPFILEEYADIYPNVQIEITTDLSHRLVQKLQDGALDVCFARYSVEDENLKQLLISEDRSYAVYSKPFAMEDLPNIPYIEFGKNEATLAATEKWWQERFEIPHKARYKVPNADTCLSMIDHQLGYGIFPDATYFSHDSSYYALPMQLLDGTYFTRKTWMLYRKGVEVSALVSNFISFVQDIKADGLWPGAEKGEE